MSYMQANKADSARSIIGVVSHTDKHDLKLCHSYSEPVSYFGIIMLRSKLQACFPNQLTRVRYRTLERKPLLLCWVILYVLDYCYYYNCFLPGKEGRKYFQQPNYHFCFIFYTFESKKCQMPLTRAHMEGPISQPNVTVLLGIIIVNICYLCISFARKLS